MLIKYLKLKNFRQFYGAHEIQFSTDKLNKVTTVIGDNTTGKTTLLQSFSWCLYGELNLPKKKEILNLDIKDKLSANEKAHVFVEIGLIHKNKSYEIKREQEYSKASYSPIDEKLSVVYKDEHGITNIIKPRDCQNTINEILPSGLSHCFFFDNERISNITRKDQIASSVESLLGLESVVNAADHLGSRTRKTTVIGMLENELTSTSEEELLLKQNERENKVTKLDALVGKIKQYEVNINKLEEIIKGNNQVLLDNEDTIEAKLEIDKLSRLIEEVNKKIEVKEKQFLKEANNNFDVLFGYSIYSSIIEQLSTNADYNSPSRYIPEKIIEDVLKSEKCICGNHVYVESPEYNILSTLLEKAKENKVLNTKTKYINSISMLKNNFGTVFEEQDEFYKKILKLRLKIDELELKQDAKKKEISGKKDYKDLITENEELGKQIKKNQEQRELINLDAQRLKDDIKEINKHITKMTQENTKNKKVLTWIRYAEELKNYFSSFLKTQKEKIRGSLEVNINEIFSKMYSGERIIQIDEKYDVKLYYVDGADKILSIESPGLTTVKNFAYITGLVKTAHERMTSIDKEDDVISMETEPFPLIMDAPFSNADEHHISQISQVLPNIAEQIIFFTMKKDWDIAKKTMPHSGNCYTLKKLSEKKTEIIRGAHDV